MTENKVLTTAAECVKQRSALYGGQRDGFMKTAAMWSAILGVPVTARQVVLMFMANKLCRESFTHGEDNLVDIAGYAQVLADLEHEQKERIEFMHAANRSSREKLYDMYEDADNVKWKKDIVLSALQTLDMMKIMHVATMERT